MNNGSEQMEFTLCINLGKMTSEQNCYNMQ